MINKSKRKLNNRANHGNVIKRPKFKLNQTDNDQTNHLVSKQKVEELRTWLSEHKTGILVLAGPTGSGKNTLLTKLCKDLAISIVEQSVECRISTLLTNYKYQSSEVIEFRNFILQSCRFAMNSLFGNTRRRLVLIKDIPYGCIKDAEKFHNLVQCVQPILRCILAFVVSEKERSTQLVSKLFPIDLVQKMSITVIRINAITEQRIGKLIQSRYGKNDFIIHKHTNPISLLNDIEWMGSNITSNTDLQFHRDDDFCIFHWIGKILYRKVALQPEYDSPTISIQSFVESLSNFNMTEITSIFDYNFPSFSMSVEDCSNVFQNLSIYDEISSSSKLDIHNETGSHISPLLLFLLISSYLQCDPLQRNKYKWQPLKGPPRINDS